MIKARGHPKITARHSTTLMITEDEEIGTEADCVIGVKADKAVADLRDEVKAAIQSGAPIKVTLEADDIMENIRGQGHEDLQLSNSNDLVIRKSDYTCERTLMIKADKAAADLSREFVRCLRKSTVKIRILVRLQV